jgi:acetyl-CoA carboxylase biotin carboxyl carrier protein
VSLTAKEVAEIMKLLEDSVFDELTLETGDIKLKLRRSGAGSVETEEPQASPAEPAKAKPEAPTPQPSKPKERPKDPNVVDVPSPLLGVFYRAPKPGEPPFIEVGQRVEEGTVIGIIEVMKLMNSVRAGVTGEVVEIAVQNAMLVEYGDTLIRVRPAD